MAEEISEVIDLRERLICEAGTGTGKTFAYLVPALAAGVKTIISTATKTLQDQLFHRDLPLVLQALESRAGVALLKGRQNYVCLHRLEQAAVRDTADQVHTDLLRHIQRWATMTESGDLEEVRRLDDEPSLHSSVTSTTDNCLNQDCPRIDDCFVARARRRASQAEVVVVNHHLLFADMVLKETGFAELLPDAEVVILDEAHKVPDVASAFFSKSVSGQQLVSLVRDCRAAAGEEAPDTPNLITLANLADEAQRRFRVQFEGHRDGIYSDWNLALGKQPMNSPEPDAATELVHGLNRQRPLTDARHRPTKFVQQRFRLGITMRNVALGPLLVI